VGETAATPLSVSSSPVLGLATAVQRLPLKCSVSVRVPGPTPVVDSLSACWPTAQRSLLDVPSMARRLSVFGFGLADATTQHAEPFQCMISVRVWGAAVVI